VSQQQVWQDGIRWFKLQFGPAIQNATNGSPFHLDFITAIAMQESFEVWGRAYKTKTPAEVLDVCTGDIIDAPGRSAFPKNRAALEAVPNGPQMFQIARNAFVAMAQVATEYQKYVANPDKFCHAFGIFQYDIQEFQRDSAFFLNQDWGSFQNCMTKCLAELNAKWQVVYPHKKTLDDTELFYVAVAYNCGRADLGKSYRDQGFVSDGKHYGAWIEDFTTLSRNTPAAPTPAEV